MTTERFYETLSYIVELDKTLRLQAGIEAVSNNLTSLVQSPNQPPVQQQLATSLQALDTATASLREHLKPADIEAIQDVGGAEFFDPSLSDEIQASISANAMTPSVAGNFVQELANKRSKFLATVRQTIAGLDSLGIVGRVTEGGSADIAFVIPREIFDNKIKSLAKELIYINRLIAHISEATTGKVEEATLETLSSSTPTIGVRASIHVLSELATAVNGFLTAWKKVQEFRETRDKLTVLGLSGQALKEVDERITTVVEEVVETTTTTTIAHYKGAPERKHELENAIRQDTRRLFGQIERGLVVQFKAEPSEDEKDAATNKALANINSIGRSLVFPAISAAPLLLSAGNVIDDIEIVSSTTTTKKTTTKKTTDKSE